MYHFNEDGELLENALYDLKEASGRTLEGSFCSSKGVLYSVGYLLTDGEVIYNLNAFNGRKW